MSICLPISFVKSFLLENPIILTIYILFKHLLGSKVPLGIIILFIESILGK